MASVSASVSSSDNTNRNKILYMGAGVDIKKVALFPDRDVIFVDAQPYSEFGGTYDADFYRNWFVGDLISAYRKMGYVLIDEKRLTLKNTSEKKFRGKLAMKPDYYEPHLFIFQDSVFTPLKI